MGKIGVTKIEITRAEGPMALCGKTATFQSFEDAHNWLVCQSSTFPKMGYDKHDFAVSFEDGFVYQGRLDCKSLDSPNNDLDVKEHIRSLCEWYGGIAKNPHCGMEKYKRILARERYAKAAPRYLEILEKYDV